MSAKKILTSSFGKKYKVNISGGSHEECMKVTIEGIPTDFKINVKQLLDFLSRRSPGNSEITTKRKEDDIPYILLEGDYICIDQFEVINIPKSGKITCIIRNQNFNSDEYNLKLPRPGHSDFTAYLKYKDTINMSGGGPFSGRMTAMLTVAGGIAIQILEKSNIEIGSDIISIGSIQKQSYDNNITPVSLPISDEMYQEILKISKDGDSIGGIVKVFANNLPVGLGGPMYDGVESVLSPIFFGIPGVKGVEFGNGFDATKITGSENNDEYILPYSDKCILTATNNHGGILGGLSSGMPLTANIAFKPTPSISKKQNTINLKTHNIENLTISGRHDPCIAIRGAVAAEAALACGVLDLILINSYNDILNKQNTEDSLISLRDDIDRLDLEITKLLDKRMEISKKVARYKYAHNLEIENLKREQEIIDKIDKKYQNIFIEIFKTSKAIQKNLLDKLKGGSR